MWSLYVRDGHARKRALAGHILSADVEVHAGHGTQPPDGGEGQSSRANRATLFGEIFERTRGLLRVKLWKRIYCSSRLFSDAMSSLT